jgi:hypothetical protein
MNFSNIGQIGQSSSRSFGNRKQNIDHLIDPYIRRYYLTKCAINSAGLGFLTYSSNDHSILIYFLFFAVLEKFKSSNDRQIFLWFRNMQIDFFCHKKVKL